mmetsp:Transcript_27523/g.69149  ORF Transcript_27523/g.69149 Transcript_27523/m.69149 type:complete len:247 (-) Transcript_27523:737-1477(-)
MTSSSPTPQNKPPFAQKLPPSPPPHPTSSSSASSPFFDTTLGTTHSLTIIRLPITNGKYKLVLLSILIAHITPRHPACSAVNAPASRSPASLTGSPAGSAAGSTTRVVVRSRRRKALPAIMLIPRKRKRPGTSAEGTRLRSGTRKREQPMRTLTRMLETRVSTTSGMSGRGSEGVGDSEAGAGRKEVRERMWLRDWTVAATSHGRPHIEQRKVTMPSARRSWWYAGGLVRRWTRELTTRVEMFWSR